MSARERQRERRRAREEKMKKAIDSGQAIRMTYEERTRKCSLPNRVNMLGSVEAKSEENQEMVEKATAVYRQMLPKLLENLSKIEDPRCPHKVKHKLTVLMLYGMLMFVFHIGSRRDTNREMNDIRFKNLTEIFPELETMPHADTLARLLERIDVTEIQEAMISLLKDLIRRKKLRNYLHGKRLLIAIDGTQKFFRHYQWDPENPGLVRRVGENKEEQHFVYVLESVVILSNGVTLPLYSEFLKGDDMAADPEMASTEDKPSSVEEQKKQDSERKAFRRLTARIKALFRNTPITVVADGLYACGPIIQLCQKYKWGYMIVLKPEAMPAVWEDALGIMQLEEKNRIKVMWGDRTQLYVWANDMEYEYRGKDKVIRRLKLHAVICYESWIEDHPRSTGKQEHETRYAWLSSTPLNASNVYNRCCKMGRYRWKIENNILTEKEQGYSYEHCYSYTWNAMEGYHYLMKIGRFLNVMAVNSEWLNDYVKSLGIRPFIRNLWSILGGTLLDHDRIRKVADSMHQWRLVPAA